MDANYANDIEDRKSYSGFTFLLGGEAVTKQAKQSKKQVTVAISTSEVEYIALSKACKEEKFLSNLLCEITNRKTLITVFNDNQTALAWASEQLPYNRTKHIDIKNHFVYEAIKSKIVKLHYVNTKEMIRDILIKALRQKNNKFAKGLGLKIKKM